MVFIAGRIGLGHVIHRLVLGNRNIDFYECFINEKLAYGIDLGVVDVPGQLYLIYVPVDVLLDSGYISTNISLEYNGTKGVTSFFGDKNELNGLIKKFNVYITLKFPDYSLKGDLFLVNDVNKFFCKIKD